MHFCKAEATYVLALSLTLFSIVASGVAMNTPWLENRNGHSIGLFRYCMKDNCEEFPPRIICEAHQGFCGGWRTSVFLLTLALVPAVLAFLALSFSWAFRHRKKTVLVVRYLSGSVLILQVLGLVVFSATYPDIPKVLGTKYKLLKGFELVVASAFVQLVEILLMIVFRRIVKGPEETEDYDSDDEYYQEYTDTVSIDEDIPDEEVDFFIFNKQARRRELEARR